MYIIEDIRREISNKPKSSYAQWNPYAFKLWYDGMTKKEK